MFNVISRLPGDSQVTTQKAGAPSSASSALYDQILRSVLLSMEAPTASPQTAPEPAAEAHWRENRTLEDVMMQRQLTCSLSDVDSTWPAEQLALHAQPLVPFGDSENTATNALLKEALNPWELLLGRLTLQQRLAG